ncbi:hypothetical protein [uncultured Treponema sp.]|uniref:hypothetical protein n=1 Tax=uncultured Treponema sp. TaxID=162155 RepID=UPI0025E6FAA1|nr:hypothetical protein [uncultured Treponema sp.]
MRFLCSGRERKPFEVLCGLLSDERVSLDFCEDGLSLLQKVILGAHHPDVIILDYALYKGFSELIFNLLASKNLIIPVLLFGEKVQGKDAMIANWISDNELHFNNQTFHDKILLFNKISLALQNDELKSLLYTPPLLKNDFEDLPASLPSEKLIVKSKRENLLEHVLNKNSFSPSVFHLLSFMYKNRRREVSIDEISSCLDLSGKSEKSRKNVTYAYISRLRKSLMKIPLCPLCLVRPRTGFYRLILK